MGTLAKGLIAGSAIGIIGLAFAMSDKRTRRTLMKNGERVMDKAHKFIEH